MGSYRVRTRPGNAGKNLNSVYHFPGLEILENGSREVLENSSKKEQRDGKIQQLKKIVNAQWQSWKIFF